MKATEIEFPPIMMNPRTLFRNEAALCDHMLSDRMFWLRIGLDIPKDWRSHITPDFMTTVRGSKTKWKRKGVPFGLEAEMTTAGFNSHGHDPSINIHLIVTLQSMWTTRSIAKVDVISYYRKCPDGWYRYSLDDDIGMLFNEYRSFLFPHIKAGEGYAHNRIFRKGSRIGKVKEGSSVFV